MVKEGTKSLTVRIRPELFAALKAIAASDLRSVNKTIELAVTRYVEECKRSEEVGNESYK